jgi:L-methionine (R)-S-oxide reductase
VSPGLDIIRDVTSSDLVVERLVVGAVETAASLDEALRAAVTNLAASAEGYHWVGIYLLEGDTLVLHNEVGKPTPHRRIALAQGICGAAAREGRTIVVADVRLDPRYLACSAETRSEIVVPIVDRAGRVRGEIDVDSDAPAAFDAGDTALLETVAAALAVRFPDRPAPGQPRPE